MPKEFVGSLRRNDAGTRWLYGYGVLTALRQDPATKTIPFIFVTAKTTKVELHQAIELGADDYLTKPFTAVELS